MSTTIEKGMLVAIKDVNEAGIWRGLSGKVMSVRGPSIHVYVPAFADEALLTADLLQPSPQLNLLVEGEDLPGDEIIFDRMNTRFRGARVRSFIEVIIADGNGSDHPHDDPIRDVTYLIDPHDGSVVFAIDPLKAEIKVHDQREESS